MSLSYSERDENWLLVTLILCFSIGLYFFLIALDHFEPIAVHLNQVQQEKVKIMLMPVPKPVVVPKPKTKPVAVPKTKPVAVPKTKPVAVPKTKPVTVPKTKPVAVPKTKPVTKSKPVVTPTAVPKPAVNPQALDDIFSTTASHEGKQYKYHATQSMKSHLPKKSTSLVSSFRAKQGATINDTLTLANNTAQGSSRELFKQEKSDVLTHEIASQSIAEGQTIASLFLELNPEIVQRINAQGVRKTTLRCTMHLTKGMIIKVTVSPAFGKLQDSLRALLIGRRISDPYTGVKRYDLRVN